VQPLHPGVACCEAMSELPVRCVLLGAAGQLGFDLGRTFNMPDEIVPLTRADLDILDTARVSELLRELQPTHVVNATAYNQVDRAEDDPAPAFAVNATAVEHLASTCQELGATLIHFSTDYVFDGRGRTPYSERDTPNPINRYGESKLLGERLAQAACERVLIIRVCGLFGVARATGHGTNFVETMLRLAAAGRPLRVVTDQVLTPSYTLELAKKVWRLLPKAAPGIYHLTNAGQTSWYDFTREIFSLSGLDVEVTPVTAAEFGARARRPAYSVLAHDGLAALGEDDLGTWRQALDTYLRERATVRSPGVAPPGF
jgi:dTDP-4-dehydrorhamnose reductase